MHVGIHSAKSKPAMQLHPLVLLLVSALALAAIAEKPDRDELLQRALQRRAVFRDARDKKLEYHWRQQAEADMARLPKKSSTRATNPEDKQALMAFYQTTNGPKWANNSGWMKGDPCQDLWYGVYCVYGRVLQINLVYNLLSGYIPPDISRASELQVLRLYSNDIGGTLPPGLFQIKSLQILDLNNNQIVGSLPGSISLQNLTQLSLYANKLDGYLPTTWDTPSLQILSLSSNQFQGPLPPSVGGLGRLTQLVLSYNMLTGSLPAEYGKLANLQQLWLFGNAFTDPVIPKYWQSMKSLQDIEMDMLKGELPEWIGDSWTNLEILILSNGGLTGQFPTTLCSLGKLQHLRIFNNSFTGTLPSCVCQMTTLLDFEVSDNSFTGSIPDCIGQLRNLGFLYLSRNNITGTLPVSMGQMVMAQIIDVSSNGITGSIPSSFGNLVQETVGFSLCYNKLSSIEDGLENFFNHIKDYSCALYSNPWTCPVPSVVPKECQAECSNCNSGPRHTNCSSCTSDSDCGWCNEGPNCLEGSSSGPNDIYWCKPKDWSYGTQSRCP